MSSTTPRRVRCPGEPVVAEQRRAHVDHMAHRGTHDVGTGGSPPSKMRAALIATAVLITVIAVLGALLGATDPGTTPADISTGAPADPGLTGGRLAGVDASTSSTESRWLTIRDEDPGPDRPERSAGSATVAVPAQGPGEFEIAAAPDQPLPHGAFTYTVEVEQTLTFAPDQVARFVDATLTDRRGWSTEARPLVRVDAAPAVRVLLATPATADALCAPLQTGGRLSCRNGANVVLNAWRWVNGTRGYTNLLDYRRYVVNHEVGHALGNAHQPCPAPGAVAPVMLQQSLGLDGCLPNPWPDPSTQTQH